MVTVGGEKICRGVATEAVEVEYHMYSGVSPMTDGATGDFDPSAELKILNV